MKNGLKVWHCKRISDEGDRRELFAKPIEYVLRPHFLTIQPASGYDAVSEFGERLNGLWYAMGQPYDYWASQVNEGDRFYIDGAIPFGLESAEEPEDGWGFDANVRVYSVRLQNVGVKFILQVIE